MEKEMQVRRQHVMPFSAAIETDGRVRFRLWAPQAQRVELCLTEDAGDVYLAMTGDADGWHELISARASAGSRYRFRINAELHVPDPASRFQPDDVHGASEVVDAQAYAWRDGAWRGRPWEEAVVYELHVGSFSATGDFAGVEAHLDELVQLGVSAIELMPVADFPGARNWGYDGVLLFAPDASYGRPEDLKHLIDSAHAKGLMVLLDVVYNHFGPDGNYLHATAPQFFTDRHHTPWGAAINYDGAMSRDVRDFFIHNALYWLEEYHFDGLRLDAVHAIADDTQPHILDELADAVARGPGAQRHVHLVLENEDNVARHLQAASGQTPAYAAQWNDDIHHALHVIVTGEQGGYYADYAQHPLRHLGRCLTEGFAYQGDPSPYRDGQSRGTASRQLPLMRFVNFLQNHDQIGNRAFGERITALARPEAVRAVTEVLLLAPSPPLLFMGQEWAAPEPFLFFCDFNGDLAQAVTAGRRREFARFPQFSDPAARARIPDPGAPATFLASCLDWSQRDAPQHREWLALHRELLRLRALHIVPRIKTLITAAAGYQLLNERALRVAWPCTDDQTLVMLANLGELDMQIAARPAGVQLYVQGINELATGGLQLPPWSTGWWLAPTADG